MMLAEHPCAERKRTFPINMKKRGLTITARRGLQNIDSLI
jgi:hypothetical protein